MVVLVKRGADVGRWAVIQQRPDEVSTYDQVWWRVLSTSDYAIFLQSNCTIHLY
jgi:hypothetical protein